ncbi:hypothetical protein [Flavobacterium cyanobacteriorum]|nr:hypothetical protein [Flavobacterium cyanobacteriorum]
MKKVFLLLITTIILCACKSDVNINSITFKELDSINSEPKEHIIKFLENSDYVLLNNQPTSEQWKSNNGKEIIQFNGEGVLVFLTYNENIYTSLIEDLKKSKYISTGTSVNNGIEVESYSKNHETIFISSSINTDKENKIYSITFLK